jgi:hypothetical protein
MPFTVAHAAVVPPLVGPLGRLAVPSALVIGSMVPDFVYFLPLGVARFQSHSLAGVLWFCLPVGLATYLVFHLLLAAPLVSLLPPIADRLAPRRPRTLPRAPWLAVCVSLLVGALSHVAWDAFTHEGTPVVRALPWLEIRFVSIAGYRVVAYKVLQHMSTMVGLLVVAAWTARWMARTPRLETGHARVRPAHAVVVWASMLVAVGAWALLEAWPALAGGLSLPSLQAFAFRAAVAGMASSGVVLVALGVVWNVAVGGGPKDRGRSSRAR